MDRLSPILAGQFEAALSMLTRCIEMCPPEHWEGKIAQDSFRQIAYHALFYVDYFLSASDTDFHLRDLHQRGGDERGPALSPGLAKDETLAYAAMCRDKLTQALAAETPASLTAPCKFPRKTMSRAELYIYALRHVQHHTGAISAHLRRIPGALPDPKSLPWVPTGWV